MSKDGKTADAALQAYKACRPSFKTIAQHVHDVIRDNCDPKLIHQIEYRAKEVQKLYNKACKTNDDGSPRYPDPLNQITDLAGVGLSCSYSSLLRTYVVQ